MIRQTTVTLDVTDLIRFLDRRPIPAPIVPEDLLEILNAYVRRSKWEFDITQQSRDDLVYCFLELMSREYLEKKSKISALLGAKSRGFHAFRLYYFNMSRIHYNSELIRAETILRELSQKTYCPRLKGGVDITIAAVHNLKYL